MSPARYTHLLDVHGQLGAKLTEFGGWDMPLQYSGIIAEHNAVREGAGVFDVSHLGKLRLTGPGSVEALQVALTADVGALDVGRATYSLVLADDGGCIDDVFVYRLGDEEWMVVPNAANVSAVTEAIEASGANVTDEWDRYAILAVQGPHSFDVFERAWPGSGATELRLHAWRRIDVGGEMGLVARTGYTGERGFELYAPAKAAADAFRRLLDAGASPVGLGARDTLRLEMGYALYEHELSLDVNPLEAGLGWALAWDTAFRGREALLKVKEAGPARKLFGIRCEGRGVPRRGHPVLADGEPIATVTSGNYSPTLRTGIALALGDAARIPKIGAEVVVEARGRGIAGAIVKPPFIESERSTGGSRRKSERSTGGSRRKSERSTGGSRR
ncbi:MAG: glycine cleavage system aminomethyltransferase GcvT, partial [Actinomycetota bacterium]